MGKERQITSEAEVHAFNRVHWNTLLGLGAKSVVPLAMVPRRPKYGVTAAVIFTDLEKATKAKEKVAQLAVKERVNANVFVGNLALA